MALFPNLDSVKDNAVQSFADYLDALNTPLPSHNYLSLSDFLLKSTNDQKRIFEGWGTVEIKDRQGDLIPIEAFEPVMKKLMQRGAPILDAHSNRHVGKIVDYEFRDKNGKKGLWLKGEIFDDYSSDNRVWDAIKRGLITGFSLGGRAKPGAQQLAYDATSGDWYKKIKDLEIWEFSVVETPANPEAKITDVNKLAKQLDLAKKMSWDECVRTMEDEYGTGNPKVYASCNALVSEGKVSPCPTSKMDAMEKDMQHYVTKLMEEINKMAVNLKVTPTAPVQPEEEKQEVPPAAAVDESGKNAMILQEILKRLTALEQQVFPKEASAETPPQAEVSEEQFKSLMKGAFQDMMTEQGWVVRSSTGRPLEKAQTSTAPDEPAKTINLTELSYSDLGRLYVEKSPGLRKAFPFLWRNR